MPLTSGAVDGRIAGGAALSLLVWLVCLVSMRVATRPLTPRPYPGQDRTRPPGSPALAALLLGRRELPRRILTATLLDLATRGHVDLPVNEGVVWVRLRRRPDENLTAHERLVLEHVARRCAGELTPLAACAVNGADATAALCTAFGRAVTDEAVRGGLCVRRCPRPVRLLLRLTAFVPFALLALSVARKVPVWTTVIYIGVAVLLGWWLGRLTRPLTSYRLNRLGRAQATRWAALRAALTDLPAAFGVALGAPIWPPVATFHEPDRESVWSHVTGTWRRLTVREDHTEGWREDRSAIVARALAVGVAMFFTTLLSWGLADLVPIGSWRLSWVVAPVLGISTGAACIFLFRDTWPLARDFLRTPVVEIADVVYTEHVGSTGEYSASYNYVGLDAGTSDVVTLWDVPTSTFRQLAHGVRVELRHTPARQGLRSMAVLSHPTDIRWPPDLDNHQTT
jgi:hypothetical protein